MELQDLKSQADIEVVLNKLRLYGICIIPEFISSNKLDDLRSEFLAYFDEGDNSINSKHSHATNVDGMVVRVNRSRISKDKYPIISSTFEADLMNQVSKKYFSPYDYALNEEIFLTHEYPCETPILPWHFDRQQALKFFIYVKDASKNDGAFEFAPGSHKEGRYRANYHLAIGVNERQIPNDIPEDEVLNKLTIEGKAGDLIIFDPDGFHRGGVVGEGGERMVMRGHTHPKVYDSMISKINKKIYQTLVQSPINISKILSGSNKRFIGNQIESKASLDRPDK